MKKCDKVKLHHMIWIVRGHMNEKLTIKYKSLKNDVERKEFLSIFFWDLTDKDFKKIKKELWDWDNIDLWKYLEDNLHTYSNKKAVTFNPYKEFIIWWSLFLFANLENIDSKALEYLDNFLFNFKAYDWKTLFTRELEEWWEIEIKLITKWWLVWMWDDLYVDYEAFWYNPRSMFFNILWSELADKISLVNNKEWQEENFYTYYKQFIKHYHDFITSTYFYEWNVEKIVKNFEKNLWDHKDKEKIIKNLKELFEKIQEDIFIVNRMKFLNVDDYMEKMEDNINYLTNYSFVINTLYDSLFFNAIIKWTWWDIKQSIKALLNIWWNNEKVDEIAKTIENMYNKMWIKKIPPLKRDWDLTYLLSANSDFPITSNDTIWFYLNKYWIIFANYANMVYTWKLANYSLTTWIHELTHHINSTIVINSAWWILSKKTNNLIFDWHWEIIDTIINSSDKQIIKDKIKLLKEWLKTNLELIKEIESSLWKDVNFNFIFKIINVYDHSIMDEIVAYSVESFVKSKLLQNWKDWFFKRMSNITNFLWASSDIKDLKLIIQKNIKDLEELVNEDVNKIHKYFSEHKTENDLYMNFVGSQKSKKNLTYKTKDEELWLADSLKDKLVKSKFNEIEILARWNETIEQIFEDWYKIWEWIQVKPKKVVYINSLSEDKITQLITKFNSRELKKVVLKAGNSEDVEVKNVVKNSWDKEINNLYDEWDNHIYIVDQDFLDKWLDVEWKKLIPSNDDIYFVFKDKDWNLVAYTSSPDVKWINITDEEEVVKDLKEWIMPNIEKDWLNKIIEEAVGWSYVDLNKFKELEKIVKEKDYSRVSVLIAKQKSLASIYNWIFSYNYIYSSKYLPFTPTWYITTDWWLNMLAKASTYYKSHYLINSTRTILKDLNMNIWDIDFLKNIFFPPLEQNETIKKLNNTIKKYYISWVINKLFGTEKISLPRDIYSQLWKILINKYKKYINELYTIKNEKWKVTSLDIITALAKHLPFFVADSNDYLFIELRKAELLKQAMEELVDVYKKSDINFSWEKYEEVFSDFIDQLPSSFKEHLEFLNAPNSFIKKNIKLNENIAKKSYSKTKWKEIDIKYLDELIKKYWANIKKINEHITKDLNEWAFFNYDSFIKSLDRDEVKAVANDIDAKFAEKDDILPETVYNYIEKKSNLYRKDPKKNIMYKPYFTYLTRLTAIFKDLWIDVANKTEYVLPLEKIKERVRAKMAEKDYIIQNTYVYESENMKEKKDKILKTYSRMFLPNATTNYFLESWLAIEKKVLDEFVNRITNGEIELNSALEKMQTIENYFQKKIAWDITSVDIEMFNAILYSDKYNILIWLYSSLWKMNNDYYLANAKDVYNKIKSYSLEWWQEFLENTKLTEDDFEKHKTDVIYLQASSKIVDYLNKINNTVNDFKIIDTMTQQYEKYKRIISSEEYAKKYWEEIYSNLSDWYDMYIPTLWWLVSYIKHINTRKISKLNKIEKLESAVNSNLIIKNYQELPREELVQWIKDNNWVFPLSKKTINKIIDLYNFHLLETKNVLTELDAELTVLVKKLNNNKIKSQVLRYKQKELYSLTTVVKEHVNKVEQYFTLIKALWLSDNKEINELMLNLKQLWKKISEDIKNTKKIWNHVWFKNLIEKIEKILDNKIKQVDKDWKIDLVKIFAEKKTWPDTVKTAARIEIPLIQVENIPVLKTIKVKNEQWETVSKTIINREKRNNFIVMQVNEFDVYVAAYKHKLEKIKQYINKQDELTEENANLLYHINDFLNNIDFYSQDKLTFTSKVNEIDNILLWSKKELAKELFEKIRETGIFDNFWWFKIEQVTKWWEELVSTIDINSNLEDWIKNIEWKKVNINKISPSIVVNTLKPFYPTLTEDDVIYNPVYMGIYKTYISRETNKWFDAVPKKNLIRIDETRLPSNSYMFIGNRSLKWLEDSDYYIITLNESEIWKWYSFWNIWENYNTIKDWPAKDINDKIINLILTMQNSWRETGRLLTFRQTKEKFLKWIDKIKKFTDERYMTNVYKNIQLFYDDAFKNLVLWQVLNKIIKLSSNKNDFIKRFKSFYLELFNQTNFWWVYKQLIDWLEEIRKNFPQAEDLLSDINQLLPLDADELIWEQFEKYLWDTYDAFSPIIDLLHKQQNKIDSLKDKFEKSPWYKDLEKMWKDIIDEISEAVELNEKISNFKETYLWWIIDIDNLLSKWEYDISLDQLEEMLTSIDRKINNIWFQRWKNYYYNDKINKHIPSIKNILWDVWKEKEVRIFDDILNKTKYNEDTWEMKYISDCKI